MLMTSKLLWLGSTCLVGFIVAVLYHDEFWEKTKRNFRDSFFSKPHAPEIPKKIETSSVDLIDEVKSPDGAIKIQATLKLREQNVKKSREQRQKNEAAAGEAFVELDKAMAKRMDRK